MPLKKPKNYALLSTLSLIIFLPLGLVSQYYAFKVDELYYTGEEEKSKKASKKAITFALISIAMGLLGLITAVVAVIWAAGLVMSSLQTFSIDMLLSETLKNALNTNTGTTLENGVLPPSDGLTDPLDTGVAITDTESIKELNELIEHMNTAP